MPRATDGPTRQQWFIATMGAMGVLLDGYDLSVISFSALLISNIFHVPSSGLEYALLLSSSLIGMVVGGLLFGRLADVLGRKAMFVVDLLMFVIFAALSALATNVAEVIIFRALMGVGIGADYPISSSLIAEFSPKRSRGMLLMYGIMFYWLGAFLSGIVNYLALPLGPGISWRVALGLGAAIAIPIITVRWLIPESARWLAAMGRRKEAEDAAERVWGTREVPEQRIAGTRELLRRHRRQLLYVLIAWFAFDVGSYGLGFYMPTLYYELGIRSLPTIALFTAFTAPFPILSYLVLALIVDRVGRRIPTLIGFGVMAAVLGLLVPLVHVTPYLLFPLFATFAAFEQWPGGILTFAYSVEPFPTRIRGLAQGLATAVSRIGAVMGILVFPYVKSYGLVYGTLFFVAFVLIGLLTTAFMAPETSGRALEELS
ncbi:MAG: MFS transporter [Nitrososphaeria archaeon]